MAIQSDMCRGIETTPHVQEKKKPLIVQNCRLINRRKFESVIRCIASGMVKTPKSTEKFLLVGCQDKNLYVLDPDFLLLQEIKFDQWVRCIATGDLNNDGIDDLAVGLGDKTFRIFHRQKDDYIEAISYHFENFVNTCAIADIDGDGQKEVLAGSWDKSMVVFDGQSFAVKWTKKFPREVSLIKVADFNWDGKAEVIVITQGGTVQALDGATGTELWQFKDEKDLLALDVGTFDSTGYPYLVVGGKSQKLFFFDRAGQLVNQIKTEQQVLSLEIADVDGDNRNEIVLGLAENMISTYEMKSDKVTEIAKRWSIKTAGAINDMLVFDFNDDGKNELVYGGYDCNLSLSMDFFYGTKPPVAAVTPPAFGSNQLAPNANLSWSDNEPAGKASTVSSDGSVIATTLERNPPGESKTTLATDKTIREESTRTPVSESTTRNAEKIEREAHTTLQSSDTLTLKRSAATSSPPVNGGTAHATAGTDSNPPANGKSDAESQAKTSGNGSEPAKD